MLIVAKYTVKEMLRKKVLLLTLILTLIFLAIYGTGLHYVNADLARMVDQKNALYISLWQTTWVMMGLYLGSFIIAFLAIFSSLGMISSEIDSGVLHAVLSRPIRRMDVVLGKWLGCAAVLTVFAAAFFLAVIWLNHYFTGYQPINVLAGLATFCFQSWILLGLTVMGSTFLPTLGNGVAVFLLYCLGFVGGFIEQIGVMAHSQKLINIGIISSLIIPVDSLYRRLVSIMLPVSGNLIEAMMRTLGPLGSLSTPSGWMMAYAGLYLVVSLVIAVRVFNKRDL